MKKIKRYLPIPLLISLLLMSSCQSFSSHQYGLRTQGKRAPSSVEETPCFELLESLLKRQDQSLLKALDKDAMEVEPVFFAGFVAYLRHSDSGGEVVVRRTSDGKIQFHAPLAKKPEKSNELASDLKRLAYDEKKGKLYLVKDSDKWIKVRGFALKPIERKPVSYNEVLEIMKKDPYPVGRAPTIPLQMFRFFKNIFVDFFVGRRSKEILTKGADYRTIGANKPIHPMGVGVEGKMVFHSTKYSGAFRGGEFPLLGRFSISQGNPSKYKKRTWLERAMGKPAKKEARSVAAAFKIFPTADKNEAVVTANAVFQNDLNGEVLEHFTDGVMTNHPQLNALKIRHSYEIFTLLGVAKGALSSPNDLKKNFPFMNPQLRPLHQYAEMGEVDPSHVRTPTWIKIQAEDSLEPIARDDFREELVETVAQKGLRYQIFLADEVDEQGEIIWEEAGYMDFTNTILSRGVDQNLLFHHDGLRSPFTGEMIDPDTIPKPIREE